MGLLEEAIREHLELQRRRGADPNRVARAEQEALEPLVPGQTPAWAEGPMLFDHQQPPSEPAIGVAAAAPQHGVAARPPLIEQETAELDMSTVLGESATRRDPAQPPPPEVPEFGAVRARRIVRGREAAGVAGTEAAGTGENGDFEWEIPARSAPVSSSQPSARRGSFVFE